MKPYWTFTKTTLALVSVGILLAPTLRRLGYLPPETTAEPEKETVDEAATRMVAPPELSAASNGNGEFSFPRH